jgi:hypothetical protein
MSRFPLKALASALCASLTSVAHVSEAWLAGKSPNATTAKLITPTSRGPITNNAPLIEAVLMPDDVNTLSGRLGQVGEARLNQ